MEYKTITRPDARSSSSPYMTENAASGWRAFTTACRRPRKSARRSGSLPVKINRRADGTVSVGTQSLVPWETDYGKLEMMADVYLNYLAQVFNLPDDGFVRTRLAFGGESAEHDGVMTAEERETVR